MTPARTSATPGSPGRQMDLRKIVRAGDRRARALAQADAALSDLADELLACGELANIGLAANLSKVARTTLYRRIVQRRATPPSA